MAWLPYSRMHLFCWRVFDYLASLSIYESLKIFLHDLTLSCLYIFGNNESMRFMIVKHLSSYYEWENIWENKIIFLNLESIKMVILKQTSLHQFTHGFPFLSFSVETT